jgi:peptidoglycan/LPS O-acetylase OafA/YrhL
LLVGAAVVVTYIIAIPISSNWLFGWLLAVGIFALYHVGRTATWPRWLVWCGVVSYSLYLLHTLPLNWFGVWGAPLAIALAGISYRLIEQPMIRLGRSLDRSAARAPARAPA